MTTRWFAEKMPSGAFRAVAASSAVERLFSDLARDVEPRTTFIVRTGFARRTDAVRKRMALSHEPGHLLAEHARNSAAVGHVIEMSAGVGKTQAFATVIAQFLADAPSTPVTLSAIGSTSRNTPCGRDEGLYHSLQSRYPVLLSAEQRDRSAHGNDGLGVVTPDRATLRDMVRSLTKAVLAAAPGQMGWRFFAAYQGVVRGAASLLRMPDPAESPGQLVAAHRRAPRGPCSSRTCMTFVHGVATA